MSRSSTWPSPEWRKFFGEVGPASENYHRRADYLKKSSFRVIDTRRFGTEEAAPAEESDPMNLAGRILFKGGVLLRDLAYRVGR
jgi:hypothetical protein